ncbi:MAG TPA: Tad domain-containing protein [Herpetosiphonaceae bacterium]
MKLPRRKHQGQALVTMVIFAIVLFLFVGLGVDSGMIYMERRHLQNVADAACLAAATEISLGGTATSARTAANNYIISNMDANARAAFDLPADLNTLDFLSTTTGTGVNLTRGIEVNGSDVRVAVTFPAFTYFMRLGGIETYDVMARARCDATQGGGVWPVAVVRFPGYDDKDARVGLANTGVTLPQTYGNGTKQKYLKVRDILQAGDGVLNDGSGVGGSGCSTTRNWYDWPSLGDPASKTGPFHQPCQAASLANPGYEVEMSGQGAQSNVSNNNSYSGPLILDARQISFTPHLFYNGQSASTSLNAWKDTITKYILTQYPGPDVLPGQQIGIISGITAGQIEKPMRDRYDEGDIVTTLIYNGQLYQDPDFKLTVVCKAGSFNCNNPPSGGQFTYRVAPPTTLFNTACTQYSGDPYVADGSDPDFSKANPRPKPAEYTVSLAPAAAQTAAATTVQLTARLSGNNVGSAGGTGSPEDFAHMKVRWEWVDASGGTHYAPSSSGWQSGDTPVNVDMPIAGTTVTLKVIQSDKEVKQCFDPTNPLVPIDITVPKRVSGAQTIQVTGRSVGGAGTSRQHSGYGLLGMRRNLSGSFYSSNDFFFSFTNDPIGVLKNSGPKTDLEVSVELVDANSASSNTLSWTAISSSSVTYYKDGSRLSGAPAGITAAASHSGQKPTLKVSINPATAAVGEYDIDYQVTTSGGTHSARFHLRIEESLNASIDSWIVNLCYANFKITDMSAPNVVKGQAVSGCLDPGQITAGLTSRLLPWT